MIETKRLLLRGWRDEDLEPYARQGADPGVMRYIGVGSTLTPKQSEEQILRFVRHREERGFGLWAVEERRSKAFVGFAGLAHQEGGPRARTKPRWGGVSDASSGDAASPRRRPRRA